MSSYHRNQRPREDRREGGGGGGDLRHILESKRNRDDHQRQKERWSENRNYEIRIGRDSRDREVRPRHDPVHHRGSRDRRPRSPMTLSYDTEGNPEEAERRRRRDRSPLTKSYDSRREERRRSPLTKNYGAGREERRRSPLTRSYDGGWGRPSTNGERIHHTDPRYNPPGRYYPSGSRQRSKSRDKKNKEVDLERPASPIPLEEDMKRREERAKKQEEKDETDKKAIDDAMGDLEEVDEVVIPEKRTGNDLDGSIIEVGCDSIGSLPSISGERAKMSDFSTISSEVNSKSGDTFKPRHELKKGPRPGPSRDSANRRHDDRSRTRERDGSERRGRPMERNGGARHEHSNHRDHSPRRQDFERRSPPRHFSPPRERRFSPGRRSPPRHFSPPRPSPPRVSFSPGPRRGPSPVRNFSPGRYFVRRDEDKPLFLSVRSPRREVRHSSLERPFPESPRGRRSPAMDFTRDMSPMEMRFSPPREEMHRRERFSPDGRHHRGGGHYSPRQDRSNSRQEHREEPRPRIFKPCLVCQSTEHRVKECPDLVCYKCQQKGHFAKECKNEAVPRNRAKERANKEGGSDAAPQEKAEPYNPEANITCYNCYTLGHHIRNCPSLICKKCGDIGHFAKKCTNEANPAKVREALKKTAPETFNYNHSSNAGGDNQWDGGSGVKEAAEQLPPRYILPTNKSLLSHYCEKLVMQGKDPSLGDDMIMTWRYAGHTEETMKALVVKENPRSQVQLRLALVKELGRVPAGQLPRHLNVGDLLDETVSFFMPETAETSSAPFSNISMSFSTPAQQPMSGYSQTPSSSYASSSYAKPTPKLPPPPPQLSSAPSPSSSSFAAPQSNQMETLQSALQNISSIERFRELDDNILSYVQRDPQKREEYEGRVESLEPLKDYNISKMKVMAEMFGLSESYIHSVSSTIQKLMAYVGFCMFTLRRSYSTFGINAVSEDLNGKLEPYSKSFPSGVTVGYIVSMVCDYLRTVC